MAPATALSNPLPQYFSLPKPMLTYLMDNFTPEQLQKFYQTCKYFFNKFQLVIIANIKIRKHYKRYFFKSGTLHVSPHDPILARLSNVWITNEIDCFREYEDNLFIPTLIPKISKCTVRKITIIDDDLWVDEFKALTEGGNVEILNLDGVNIIDSKHHRQMPFEAILSFIPNAYHIQLFPCHVTPETSTKLAAAKQNRKFSTLNLNMIDNVFDVDLFSAFLKENASSEAKINLKFSSFIDAEVFEIQMKAKLECWEPESEKPIFKCS